MIYIVIIMKIYLKLINYANRSTIITSTKDYNILKNNNPYRYQKMNNNTGFNFPRNVSSSDLFSYSKRKFNIADNNPVGGKNKTINNSLKNGDIPNLKPNFSTSEINSNNKQTRAFFGLNNNYNYLSSNSAIISQNQNNQSHNFSESMNGYQNNNFSRSFPFNNTGLEKLDKNVNINEKVINSPFQVYQTYQKGKKGNNLSNRSTQSLNTGKRVLFESNKEKDKKNKNNNNNFQSNFLNLKGKEARILQNLVYNLQSNIPEYEKGFINEEDVKNMKNKIEKNNNNI